MAHTSSTTTHINVTRGYVAIITPTQHSISHEVKLLKFLFTYECIMEVVEKKMST